MQALRLTAMGRFGHPLQEQLADKLVEVFAEHDADKANAGRERVPLMQAVGRDDLSDVVVVIPDLPSDSKSVKRPRSKPVRHEWKAD